MIHPSYNELLKTLNENREENEPEIDSRYSLVIASAKRARQIVNGQDPLADRVATYKPLSIAVEEIREGKVRITKEGEEDFKPVINMETPIAFPDTEGSETEDVE